MKKPNKPLLGFFGLIFVAIMTIVAFLIPTNDAAATDSTAMTDTLKVVVYDQYPGIVINAPTSDSVTNSDLKVSVFYENIDYIDFIASYIDEEGNTIEIPLKRFTPTDLDPIYSIASGSEVISIDLSELNIPYHNYTLTTVGHSPIGYDEDAIEITYVPAVSSENAETDDNGDPVITVDYDKGTEKLEIMAYDDNGNPLFDEPVVVNIPAPYNAGSQTIVLPFASYGIESGNYTVQITAYKHVQAVDENGNPLFDESGNPIMVLSPIDAPAMIISIVYKAPEAPAIPDTGRLLQTINTTKTDYLITVSIAMIAAVAFAIVLMNKHKRVNYRKNLRRGRGRRK